MLAYDEYSAEWLFWLGLETARTGVNFQGVATEQARRLADLEALCTKQAKEIEEFNTRRNTLENSVARLTAQINQANLAVSDEKEQTRRALKASKDLQSGMDEIRAILTEAGHEGNMADTVRKLVADRGPSGKLAGAEARELARLRGQAAAQAVTIATIHQMITEAGYTSGTMIGNMARLIIDQQAKNIAGSIGDNGPDGTTPDSAPNGKAEAA